MSSAFRTVRLRIGPGISLETPEGSRDFTEFQRALILMLADAGTRGVRRDRAAELLWAPGEEAGTSPRRRLRQIAYAINRRAGIELIRGRPDRLELGGEVEVSWSSGSLAGRIPAPTRDFERLRDEIEDRARERSRTEVMSVLDAARVADDPERILEAIARQEEPESLWRDGVWALLRSGRIREAESTLASLGIRDEEVLRRCRSMLGRLLAGEVTPPDRDTAGAPLIGRIDELAEVTRAIEVGELRTALVGPSGVGLSRILGAASAWALTETDDLVVASARCTATGRSIGYDTLNRLFDSDLFRAAWAEMEEPWKSVVARVLSRVIGAEPELDVPRLEGTSATLKVLHGIAALIDKAVGAAQLLAVIDDLHQADAASLTVLVHLGYEGDGPIVRMLATVRDDLELSGAIEGFLRKEARVIRVAPLGQDEAAELALALHPELDRADARSLAVLSDGFPRRLVEASRSVVEGGGTVHRETLGELLRRRLRDLTPVEQEVSALLAVQPGGGDAGLLMQAAETGTLQLARAIGELTRRGLLRQDSGTFHITSPFLRERIRDGIPEPMQRVLHQRIALILEARDPLPAAEVGFHLARAGRADEAAQRLIEGARQAAHEEAYPVAIDLLKNAREVSRDELSPDILDFWGGLLDSEGRFGEAWEIYPAAQAGWEEVGEAEKALWSRLGCLRAAVELGQLGEDVVDGFRAIASEAVAAGFGDLEAHAIEGLFAAAEFALRPDLVIGALQMLLDARERGVQSGFLDFVEVRRVYIDDQDRARECAWSFYSSTEPGSHERLAALNRLMLQGIVRGPPGDEDVKFASDEILNTSGPVNPMAWARLWGNLGEWHFETGEHDRAKELAHRALDTVRSIALPVPGQCLTNLAEIAIAEGVSADALRFVDQLISAGHSLIPRDQRITDALVARTELEKGSLSSASSRLNRWDRASAIRPLGSFPLAAIDCQVRLLRRLGDPKAARLLLEEAREWTEALFPRFTPIIVDLRVELRLHD